MFDEALRRNPNQEKHWGALVDGTHTQIDILKRMARKKAVKFTIIVDIVHVLEYLWKVALSSLWPWKQKKTASPKDVPPGLAGTRSS